MKPSVLGPSGSAWWSKQIDTATLEMDAPPPTATAAIKQLLASVQQANDANGWRRFQRATITPMRTPFPRWRPHLGRGGAK